MKQRKQRRRMGLFCSVVLMLTAASGVSAQYADWRHAGSMYILTTPEGADMPVSAVVEEFPLLVRLNSDFFDFAQAQPNGEDIRFSTPAGRQLSYQIEHWDARKGSAIIWVRIPSSL